MRLIFRLSPRGHFGLGTQKKFCGLKAIPSDYEHCLQKFLPYFFDLCYTDIWEGICIKIDVLGVWNKKTQKTVNQETEGTPNNNSG